MDWLCGHNMGVHASCSVRRRFLTHVSMLTKLIPGVFVPSGLRGHREPDVGEAAVAGAAAIIFRISAIYWVRYVLGWPKKQASK